MPPRLLRGRPSHFAPHTPMPMMRRHTPRLLLLLYAATAERAAAYLRRYYAAYFERQQPLLYNDAAPVSRAASLLMPIFIYTVAAPLHAVTPLRRARHAFTPRHAALCAAAAMLCRAEEPFHHFTPHSWLRQCCSSRHGTSGTPKITVRTHHHIT